MSFYSRYASFIFAGACALHAGASLAADLPLAACDGPFQTTLQPAGSALDARAVWLDQRRLRWPGAARAGTFKLYHAAGAAIVARAGAAVTGADGSLPLHLDDTPIEPARFRYLAAGPQLSHQASSDTLRALHREQIVLVREDAAGRVLDATRIQNAGALDQLYAAAVEAPDLGVTATGTGATFKLWAPTAQAVAVCLYENGSSLARAIAPMQRDDATGIWRAAHSGDISGTYYTYLVDVVAGDAGLVRNLVTDPYSISLSTDSKRSYVADLAAPGLQPPGWDATRTPQTVRGLTDMVVYELHVRDFSINDASVPAAHRGKYLAFTDTGSNGMRHLAALARAGLTDIHLLPVFDIGSVPEKGCVTPRPAGAADSESQQALVMASADRDCFNWGYDPFHYSAPEGSYASDADGKRRIIELRALVQSLHKLGLRVGMDVVYNHTYRAGEHERSVLDRIVPGYYHRLDASGKIAQSTCCDNTATEHAMMGKLMIDSVVLWATQYKIDSFRFDLMGHQPRADGAAAGQSRCRRRPPRAADRRRLEFRRSGRRRPLPAGRAAVAGRQRHRQLQRPGTRCRARRRRRGQRHRPRRPQGLFERRGHRCRRGHGQGGTGGHPARLFAQDQRRQRQNAGWHRLQRPAGRLRRAARRSRQLRGKPRQPDPVRHQCPEAPTRHQQRRTGPRADAGRRHRRLQPGRGLLPRRHRHPALQVPGPQQLQFGRLVQSARLDLPDQLFWYGAAAGGGQRQGLCVTKAASRRCASAAGSFRHRLCARRVPQSAGRARQFHPVPYAHGRGREAAAAFHGQSRSSDRGAARW